MLSQSFQKPSSSIRPSAVVLIDLSGELNTQAPKKREPIWATGTFHLGGFFILREQCFPSCFNMVTQDTVHIYVYMYVYSCASQTSAIGPPEKLSPAKAGESWGRAGNSPEHRNQAENNPPDPPPHPPPPPDPPPHPPPWSTAGSRQIARQHAARPFSLTGGGRFGGCFGTAWDESRGATGRGRRDRRGSG